MLVEGLAAGLAGITRESVQQTARGLIMADPRRAASHDDMNDLDPVGRSPRRIRARTVSAITPWPSGPSDVSYDPRASKDQPLGATRRVAGLCACGN